MQFDISPAIPSGSQSPVAIVRHYERYVIGGMLLICVLIGLWFASAPGNFPRNSVVTIPQGSSAQAFASVLQRNHLIRSAFLFRAAAHLTGFDHHLDTGAYAFTRAESLPVLLWRMGHADHRIAPVKVTITEGMTRFDIADTLQAALPGFDTKVFLEESSTSEGYLFPETYFFMSDDSPSSIVQHLTAQFASSTAEVAPRIRTSGHTERDIVIMASLLEREAKTPEDMHIVAGILWKRLTLGMSLQVDATFGYIHKQNGYAPTAADLSSNSPYNTYTHRGLPPTPISNPGLMALTAAAQPQQTKYLYYLTDSEGKMHYAVTYEQHRQNIAKYLK